MYIERHALNLNGRELPLMLLEAGRDVATSREAVRKGREATPSAPDTGPVPLRRRFPVRQ
ncbi:hypothetical protein CUR178_06663 [Leishmania enriettii]|uniref:Uncharacterized protein n=1 Tax=Leishmania enriettii TaxID=5663 RepID=A0A836KWD3_LEIEN|nr:hypothetical protein CUR178_06663 [Leishmania enriettii]